MTKVIVVETCDECPFMMYRSRSMGYFIPTCSGTMRVEMDKDLEYIITEK